MCQGEETNPIMLVVSSSRGPFMVFPNGELGSYDLLPTPSCEGVLCRYSGVGGNKDAISTPPSLKRAKTSAGDIYMVASSMLIPLDVSMKGGGVVEEFNAPWLDAVEE